MLPAGAMVTPSTTNGPRQITTSSLEAGKGPGAGYRGRRYSTVSFETEDQSSDGDSSSSDNACIPTDFSTYSNLTDFSPSTAAALLRRAATPIVDDADATYVLVFNRQYEKAVVPGWLQPLQGFLEKFLDYEWDPDLYEKPVLNPLKQARLLFPAHPKDEDIEGLSSETMTNAEYQRIVREKIDNLLLTSGFECSTFESVDGDEIFLKVHLNRDGPVAHVLAEKFEYEVPIKNSVYRCYGRSQASSQPAGPPINKNYLPCYLHVPFKQDRIDKLQPFRHVDMIRIVYRHLNSLLNLEELIKQNVIVVHFPVQGKRELKDLKSKWTTPLHLQKNLVPQEIVNYFGEKICMFFHFFIFFIRALGVLFVIAILFYWSDSNHFDMGLGYKYKAYAKMVFGGVVVIWASIFELLLNHSLRRVSQSWGMSESRIARGDVDDMPEYDKDLVGTSKEDALRASAQLATIAYCIIFMFFVAMLKSQATFDQKTKTYLVSSLIVVAKMIWGNLAPQLTYLENYKTQARFENALISKLALFKIFFFVWPPLSIFVLDEVTGASCGATLRAAVEGAYGNLSYKGHAEGYAQWPWPKEKELGELNESTYEEQMEGYILDGYHLTKRRMMFMQVGEVCISGCLPAENCHKISETERSFLGSEIKQKVDCELTCDIQLKRQIETQFLFHVVFSIIFLVVPLATTSFQIFRELAKLDGDSEYSILQVQAKCAKFAEYSYLSWGGSYVEDFLELMLSYAYICMFSMVKPSMILIAAPLQLAEYYLVVLRMRHITGRPFPAMAADIGNWAKVISVIGSAAVFFNAYIASFVMHPICIWPKKDKYLLGMTFMSFFLFLRANLRSFVDGVPHDCRHIEDYNSDVFHQEIVPSRGDEKGFEEAPKRSTLDIRLVPHSPAKVDPLVPGDSDQSRQQSWG